MKILAASFALAYASLLSFSAGCIANPDDTPAMTVLQLPKETEAFLRYREELVYDSVRCEPGKVQLHRVEDLKLSEVWMEVGRAGDPNVGVKGYYSIPAVSLTAKCEGYDPAFILLWLPNEKEFGTWDSDHWELLVFERATWADIVATPADYINAQWTSSQTVGRPFRPWLHYTPKAGRPF